MFNCVSRNILFGILVFGLGNLVCPPPETPIQMADDVILIENRTVVSSAVAADMACFQMRGAAAPKLILRNCMVLVEQGGFTFDSGLIEIEGDCIIKPVDSSESAGFLFATNGTLLIKSGAHLLIDAGITFVYNPSVNDAIDIHERVVLEADDSKMTLRKCLVDVRQVPMRFVQGQVFIDGIVKFVHGQEVEDGLWLGSKVNFYLLPDAEIEVC